jgi:hypothetical protein
VQSFCEPTALVAGFRTRFSSKHKARGYGSLDCFLNGIAFHGKPQVSANPDNRTPAAHR